VLGASGLVAPSGLTVAPALLTFDVLVMVAVAVACLPVFFTGRKIVRWEGALFLGYYVAYTTYLILFAQQHDALGPFSAGMMGFVLPITALTLLVVVAREWRANRTP